MIWATASVALGLLMTVLVIAELRRPVGKTLKPKKPVSHFMRGVCKVRNRITADVEAERCREEELTHAA
jgi:hypothetical protein